MEKNILIIPSLNPDKNFLFLLKKFKEKIKIENMDVKIIVVNDGSSEKCNKIFSEIENNDITVLKHNINLGKGRALKTALNYALNYITDFESVVIADSDGQHSIEDIISCLKKSNENVNKLILGTRNFDKTLKGGGENTI